MLNCNILYKRSNRAHVNLRRRQKYMFYQDSVVLGFICLVTVSAASMDNSSTESQSESLDSGEA